MKRHICYLIISFFLFLNSVEIIYSQGLKADTINDGPYIFSAKHKLKVKWIENSVLSEEYIFPETFPEFKSRFNLLCNYDDLSKNYLLKPNYSQSYNNADSIGVISDVHGKYDNYICLLKAMGIVDKNLNWKFGTGHLVVLGDIFDRGDQVTEVLWHLFGLERQAAEAGGMVHVLLGNHEIMVLGKILNYMNKKYVKVEKISGTRYYDLYSEKSVLGNWLRSKPVVITINDIIFVHGGISIEMVNRNLTVMQINRIFEDNITGKEMEVSNENAEKMFLIQDLGPVWYRGYFSDKDFTESILDSILHFYDKKHIIVGHTPSKDIKSGFSKKILGVDAGISIDQPGEMLIWKDGFFYKGYFNGARIKL